VFSFGLGGGSIVRKRDDGTVTIGPESVGYRLTDEALVFGGGTLTATDIAVAAGWADLGDTSKVAGLEPAFVSGVIDEIRTMVEAGVDRMKTSAEPMPLIVVGGGSILVQEVTGTSALIKPNHFEAANAVGAAIGQISGETDRVFALGGPDGLTRDGALAIAQAEATERAVMAGADPATIELVDLEDLPLAYLPGNATRIRAKVVGDLRMANESIED
jgi:N-methylhydantoinase A/oxoprolinase/acetone carboxylase beta subunit